MLIVYVAFLFGIFADCLNCMSIQRNQTQGFKQNLRKDLEDADRGGMRILTGSKNITFEPTKHHRFQDRVDIVFPGPFDSKYPKQKIDFLDGPPECADGATYCEKIEAYPQHILSDVLKRSKLESDYFGADEAPIEISNRNRDEEEELFFCGSNSRIIFPKIGKTKNNKWKWIINQEDSKKYIQGVRIETCIKPDEPCDLMEALPLGYTTSCRQKHVYRRLLSVSDSNEPVREFFKMPSACCCSYKRDLSFFTNFGSALINVKRRKRNEK